MARSQSTSQQQDAAGHQSGDTSYSPAIDSILHNTAPPAPLNSPDPSPPLADIFGHSDNQFDGFEAAYDSDTRHNDPTCPALPWEVPNADTEPEDFVDNMQQRDNWDIESSQSRLDGEAFIVAP